MENEKNERARKRATDYDRIAFCFRNAIFVVNFLSVRHLLLLQWFWRVAQEYANAQIKVINLGKRMSCVLFSLATSSFFLPEHFCTHTRIAQSCNRFFDFFSSLVPNYDYQPRNIAIFFSFAPIDPVRSHSLRRTHTWFSLGICLWCLIGLEHQTHGIGTDFPSKWHIATKIS